MTARQKRAIAQRFLKGESVSQLAEHAWLAPQHREQSWMEMRDVIEDALRSCLCQRTEPRPRARKK